MFRLRRTYPVHQFSPAENIKLYAISANGDAVILSKYTEQLSIVTKSKKVDWQNTPTFAIAHEGENLAYLVLAWWGNDNELFTSVSVMQGQHWVEDSTRYSFCLWDLQVFWHERNSYIRHLYSGSKNIAAYRQDYMQAIEAERENPIA